MSEHVAPPGGWKAELQGRHFVGDSLANVTADVAQFMAANGYDTSRAGALVRAQNGLRKRGILEYWQGARGLMEIAKRTVMGWPVFAESAEANRRASICVGCSCNVRGDDSSAARLTDSVMAGRVDGRTTEHDGRLGHCDVCSCPLRVTVHLDMSLLGPGYDYPTNCWRHP